MKKTFLFIALIFLACQPKEKDPVPDLIFLSLLMQQNPTIYDSAECQLFYPLNPIYVSAGYAQRFMNDGKQYENVVLGNSTMDISRSFPGFHDPNRTQINAVGGDTLCDFRSRFPYSIRTQSPENIVVSTAGGNDILRNIPLPRIVSTFEDFHSNLRSRFPSSKLSYIEVHPTFVDSANKVRKNLSSQLREISSGSCWVNPDPCFSDPLKDSEMLDAIHYNQSSAFCIRNLLKNQCEVEL